MAAYVVVVEGVEVSAQLVAFGGGPPVALGGDQACGNIAQADQFACLGQPRLVCLAGLPLVSGPEFDAAGVGVVAQCVKRGVWAAVGGGDQAGVE